MRRSLVLLTATWSAAAQAQGLTGNVLNFLQKVTPAPIVQSEDWNGTEYRYNRIVFRPARKATPCFQCHSHTRFFIQSSSLKVSLYYVS